MKWINSKSLVALALLVCVATPLLLGGSRDGGRKAKKDATSRINIITPHNETIRREFGEAFQDWWKARTGETVYVNWLTPGGTSEIRKIINGKYAAAKKLGERGIGIDVFFGGGDYDFKLQADMGHLAALGVFTKHPEWFKPESIPATFSGETYYDEGRRWVGVCLSRFGICYNVDALKRLGLDPPAQWSDLADPRYYGHLALADPTKSGSVARAFEMLIQQQIQEVMQTADPRPGETREQFTMRTRSEGWDRGINLIQRISANARYFTDSASKIPHDVAQGNAAAGMAIDFYGRAYEEKLTKNDGSSRLRWVSPRAGTSLSVDPVAVMKGAPNPRLAQAFVEFLLTERGQALWNARPGSPIGPKYRALRRMPVRRDIYTVKYLRHFTDPSNPYEETGGFVYHHEWTGKAFKTMQFIIRVMCLDSHDEIKDAWEKLTDAGMPPRASMVFHDTTRVSYQNSMGYVRSQINQGTRLKTARLEAQLGEYFRKNYRLAGDLAQQGR